MSIYNFTVNDKLLTWSEDELKNKLADLSTLNSKKGWLKANLEIAPSSWLTRIFWKLLAKYSNYLRTSLYGIDLEFSKNILIQLKPFVKKNDPLKKIYKSAIKNFNTISPKHQISNLEHKHYKMKEWKKSIEEEVKKQREKIVDLEYINKLLKNKIKKLKNLNKTVRQLKKQILINKQPTLAELISQYENSWDLINCKFTNINFNQQTFQNQLKNFNEKFPLTYDPKTHFGIAIKTDLPRNSKIYVRADIHGDLRSLLDNLKTLKQECLLDDNYVCENNVHLVFLGDYTDRGANIKEVLTILIELKIKNPEQVTLIRGNHESTAMNFGFSANSKDKEFYSFLSKNTKLIEEFYQRLPLTLYLAEENPTGKKEYVQFTHGLFELTTDPAPLLDSEKTLETFAIPNDHRLSQRINQLLELSVEKKKLIQKELKTNLLYQTVIDENIKDTSYKIDQIEKESSTQLNVFLEIKNVQPLLQEKTLWTKMKEGKHAFQCKLTMLKNELYRDRNEIKEIKKLYSVAKIAKLYVKDLAYGLVPPYKFITKGDITEQIREEDATRITNRKDITVTNWGDVSPHTYSIIKDLGTRNWKLTPKAIKHYLNISSEKNSVKLLFRGHEHTKRDHFVDEKIVIITLPIAGEFSSLYSNHRGDCFYILSTSLKVKNWKKEVYYKPNGFFEMESHGIFPIQNPENI